MKKLLTSALAATVATVALATMLTTSASAAPLSFTTIGLINGWATYSSTIRAPKVAIDAEGVVHLVGAIKNGTLAHAFTLPASFRPTKRIYIVTNLCNAEPGRLIIDPDGTVDVQADNGFGQAQCFTSLENVTFTQ